MRRKRAHANSRPTPHWQRSSHDVENSAAPHSQNKAMNQARSDRTSAACLDNDMGADLQSDWRRLSLHISPQWWSEKFSCRPQTGKRSSISKTKISVRAGWMANCRVRITKEQLQRSRKTGPHSWEIEGPAPHAQGKGQKSQDSSDTAAKQALGAVRCSNAAVGELSRKGDLQNAKYELIFG